MKTTKSKKTQYSGEITMIEFIKANPDLTTREIASCAGARYVLGEWSASPVAWSRQGYPERPTQRRSLVAL